MNYGFIRVASVSPKHKVADVNYNVGQIIESIKELNSLGVDIAVYPELSITGYTCGDLFHNQELLDKAKAGLSQISNEISDLNIHVIVGLPLRRENAIYNCAALLRGHQIDIIEKTYLPAYNEFYERRWFESADRIMGNNIVFESHGALIGIEICEDLWTPIPPSSYLSLAGAQVIFSLSASDDLVGKHDYLLSLISQQSARCVGAYVYSSAGYGESTTDLTFLPKNIVANCGTIDAENNRYDFLNSSYVIADIDLTVINRDRCHITSYADCARNNFENISHITISGESDKKSSYNIDPEFFTVNKYPFVPQNNEELDSRCEEISIIQQSALARRLNAVRSNKMVIGISGGLDSTLALLVAVETIKKTGGDVKDILGVTMPGFGTTGRTYDNAIKLMKTLGVDIREINISKAVLQHFSDINHPENKIDVTYENSQARERTQILMDVANEIGGIVVGTGDLSELALGWATYNGDHMSMYGVNTGVPKTLVKCLVDWYARNTDDELLKTTLLDVLDTPISPELTPASETGEIKQVTEDIVGPYQLHDFFLYYTLRYGFAPDRIFLYAKKAFNGVYDNLTLLKWERNFFKRFFSQQFKRSCMPDGPKVGSVCLSPRGDWRMPSDASSDLWIESIDSLIEKENSK